LCCASNDGTFDNLPVTLNVKMNEVTQWNSSRQTAPREKRPEVNNSLAGTDYMLGKLSCISAIVL